jgi:hypothetical protein
MRRSKSTQHHTHNSNMRENHRGYRRVPLDTTETVNEKGSRLTGSDDAIFLRNRFQKELDNAHASVVNHVHFVEEKGAKTKVLFNDAQRLKRDIEVHLSERNSLYESLGNLLNKETSFEKEMWKTTQDGNKITSLNIKQKFKESDVDEMRFDSMMDYLKQYPTYASKPSFKTILDQIREKEKDIRYKKENYNKTVSLYNTELLGFEKDIRKAEDKFNAYEVIFKEGKEKLDNCRYKNGFFFKLASEKTKAKVTLDTLTHRIDQFKNTLEIMKKEYSQNSGKTFVEMEY